MAAYRTIISYLLVVCVTMASTFGAVGQRWLCVDPDGAVSIEGQAQRNECCMRHSHRVASAAGCSIEASTCRDVEIASDKVTLSQERASTTINFEPVLQPVSLYPAMDLQFALHNRPTPPEKVHLRRDAPAHLSTVIMVV